MDHKKMAQEIIDDFSIIISTGNQKSDVEQVKKCAELLVAYMLKYNSNQDYWGQVEGVLTNAPSAI